MIVQENVAHPGRPCPCFFRPQVWTASSPRDIDSAKAWIQGAFPANQTGKEGEGDGETVQLIEVPNKGFGSSWKESLTPHVRIILLLHLIWVSLTFSASL